MGFVGVEASATQKTTEVAALRGVMRAALAYSVAVGWLLAVALGMFYRGAEEGTRLLAEGKIDEASVVYGRVCLINPDFKGPAELAVGTALVNGGRAAEGEGFLVSAIKHAPLDGAAHYALGQALLAQGRLKEAEAAFGTATALDPLDAAAEADLGVAIYRQGRIREAIGHEKAALRIDPSLADARRILTALEGLGDH
jgi:tetratricopeptide (TPR) repeat protein